MGLVTTYKNMLLDAFLGEGSSIIPSPACFGLSSTAIAPDGSGITEPSGGGYGRVEVVNDGTNFDPAVDGVKKNLTTIAWPEASASWGTMRYWFICDVSDNVYLYGVLDDGAGNPQPRTILGGDTFRFLANAMRIAFT